VNADVAPSGVALPPHRRVALSPLRRRSGEHMARSTATIPHASITVEADFSAVQAAIAAQGDAWRAANGRPLGPLPFLLHAVVASLRAYPEANAMLDGRELIVFDEVHLGIAVDVPGRGLVVPVIRDAHTKSVTELALAVGDLADRARSKALHPDDVVGATYTVTNVGPFGVYASSPIVNHPQVAILAMNAVTPRAVVADVASGTLEVRRIGLLTQAFDHRAFDGAYCASMLRHLAHTVADEHWTELVDAPPSPHPNHHQEER
jgi:pyruvate/2-oxoglutarate dehydrogenase complex dihydrolipoamide acyltransferase (E2) component